MQRKKFAARFGRSGTATRTNPTRCPPGEIGLSASFAIAERRAHSRENPIEPPVIDRGLNGVSVASGLPRPVEFAWHAGRGSSGYAIRVSTPLLLILPTSGMSGDLTLTFTFIVAALLAWTPENVNDTSPAL